MKIFIVMLSVVLTVTGSHAQIENPVSWKFSGKKINASTYELRMIAIIEDGWHLYSQNTPKGGPIPTAIAFSKNPLVIIKGTVKEEGKLEKRFEPIFNVDVNQYSDRVTFIQLITVKPGIKTKVSGSIKYMTCNDQECLPPKNQPFEISVK